jgi:hypothetical protein
MTLTVSAHFILIATYLHSIHTHTMSLSNSSAAVEDETTMAVSCAMKEAMAKLAMKTACSSRTPRLMHHRRYVTVKRLI